MKPKKNQGFFMSQKLKVSKKIIKIKGMHCKSCEMLIKDSLEETQGIESAELSHTAGTAIIYFDETKTNLDDIKKIVIEEGYEVV